MDDPRGNPVGTRCVAALGHADRALWRMVSFFDVPLADLEAAAAEDPAWCWPHLMRAGFLVSLTEPALLADARAALEQAELCPGASPRERAHHAAISRCAAGDWAGACGDWAQILLDHPRDLAALQWAHFFDLHRGDSRSLRSRVARVLPEWPQDDPLRPYVLGLLAFGLEECGQHAQAEALGREVCAGTAKVPSATHAVAHVLDMQGRHADGRQWLEQTRTIWGEDNGFAIHHAWHLGLFLLEAMDLPGALALYDAQLGGSNPALTLQRLDGASLLWRARLLGADVGARWADIASGWDLGVRDAGHSAFNDLHAFVVLLGLGDRVRAAALLAAVQRRAERSHEAGAAAAREVGIPLMRGLLAFCDGSPGEAVRLLLPLRERSAPLGGSHAQRDLIDWTLLAACTAPGGERRLGRALLNERRVARGDTPLAAHWRAALTR